MVTRKSRTPADNDNGADKDAPGGTPDTPEAPPLKPRLGTWEIQYWITDLTKRSKRAKLGKPFRHTGTLSDALGFAADDVQAGIRSGDEEVNEVSYVTFELLEGGKGGFFSGRASMEADADEDEDEGGAE